MLERRIFVSSISSLDPSDPRRALKDAILKKLRDAGFSPQEFMASGIPRNLAWNFETVDAVMRRCVGAIVIGFRRWHVGPLIDLASEYAHYEGAVAVIHGLPVFLLAESGVQNAGILSLAGGRVITTCPEDAGSEWADAPLFTERFEAWKQEVDGRSDIFLAFCSKSAGTAAEIQLLLEKYGAKVHRWNMDFRGGRSILEEIEKAGTTCSGGVFLFSEDDPLEGVADSAAPRDNVVFEAGYFVSAKGPDRSLIVRYGNAKMPADIGGTIYVQLAKEASVSTIEGQLGDFVTKNL
jgi:Predicted nucleotide-binding protein containing TIR-like domain